MLRSLFLDFSSLRFLNISRASCDCSIPNDRVRISEIFTRGSGAGPTCGFGMSRCEDKRKEYGCYVGCDQGSEIFTSGSGTGPTCGFGMSRCEDKRKE